jgi:hypothetical protein
MMMLTSFYDREPPANLYHYTDSAALLGIMKGRELWATHIRYLNDAREFVHAIEIAKEYVDQLQKSKSSILLRNLKWTLDGMPGNTFIISFSEVSDLLSQWRGYCPAGGYSLNFNAAKLKELAAQQLFVMVKCSYEREEQENLIKQLIHSAIDNFEGYKLPHPHTEDLNEESRAHVFCGTWFFPKMQRLASAMKHPAFSEEQEWRLVGALYKPLPPMDLRPRGSILVPFEVFKLSPNNNAPLEGIIESVMVGPNADQELATFGVERLQQLDLIRNMRIERSTAPYRVTY